MPENKFGFVIPASNEKDILLIRDNDGKHIDLKIQKRITGEDGYFYVIGLTQDGDEMVLRFRNGHVEQIIQ